MPRSPKSESTLAASTERVHPRSDDLELRPIREVVSRLHAEDRVAVHAVGLVLDQISALAELATKVLRASGRIFYVGAGTSGRLGLLDAAEAPPTFGVDHTMIQALIAGGPKAVFKAVEGAEDDVKAGSKAIRRVIRKGDLVIGLSASATTPFVRGALEEARKHEAHTALVTCNPAAADRRLADLFVLPDTGPELISGSTRLKAGTATKLVLNAVSTAAMVALGKVYRGRMVDLRPTNEKLRRRSLRIVRELTGLPEAHAAKLLKSAGGAPKVALAMHFARLSRKEAEARLREQSLREIAGP
ncbi:MAG: N-acetylmuramic acid 6-phosphate etherase [Myxococcaceae bacterium]